MLRPLRPDRITPGSMAITIRLDRVGGGVQATGLPVRSLELIGQGRVTIAADIMPAIGIARPLLSGNGFTGLL